VVIVVEQQADQHVIERELSPPSSSGSQASSPTRTANCLRMTFTWISAELMAEFLLCPQPVTVSPPQPG
jgi:hypothetical protein